MDLTPSQAADPYRMNQEKDDIIAMQHEFECSPNRSAPCTPQEDTLSVKLYPEMSFLVGSEGASVPNEFYSSSSPQAPPPLSPVALPALLSVAAVLIALAVQRRTRKRSTNDRVFPASTGLPPCHIPGHPVWGHMPNIFKPPDDAMFSSLFVDGATASGISTFWFAHMPSVGVLKAEHARVVFRNSIERRGINIINRHFKRSLGQDSLVLMECGAEDREKWRSHRNLVKVAFTTHAVENMAQRVWKVANTFTSSVWSRCDGTIQEGSSRGLYRVEAADLFKWVTLDIFGKVAFDYNFGCTETLTTTPLANSINYTVEDSTTRCKAQNLLNPLYQFYWMPTKRNRDYHFHSEKAHGVLREICQGRTREIYGRRSSFLTNSDKLKHSSSDDLLSSLIKARAELQDISPDDDHEDLIKMLFTLFFAGYDTSSVLLSMAMYCIAKHPEMQQECARESREASTEPSGVSGCTLHEDASQWESRLAYCRAVIMETARMHPPVYTNCRNLSKDLTLDGCTIPKGARVYLPISQIQTDERNFHRAKEFLPERWVRRDDATGVWVARDYHAEPKSMEGDASYVPPANPQYIFTFSDGARNCVGRRLAMQESTIVFACLLRDLEVDLPDGFVLEKRKKFALAPPAEMPLLFRKRESAR